MKKLRLPRSAGIESTEMDMVARSLVERNRGRPGFDDDGLPLRGQALVDYVRGLAGDTILLGFSIGKDSLSMWLYLRDHFNIIPFFLYRLPGMSFEEEALAYYERFFGCHIMRLPHPNLYADWRNGMFVSPDMINILLTCNPVRFEYKDVEALIAREAGLDRPFTAWGYRANDNLGRRYHILREGAAWGRHRRLYYAVWDWTIEDVAVIIKRHNVRLPRGYALWGQSCAVPWYNNLRGVREHFPDDYERIREAFPLVDAELFRWERVGYGETYA